MTHKGLSPDEISVLLGQHITGEKTVSIPSLSPFEKEVLAEVLSVSFGSTSGMLTNLFFQPVSVTGPELSMKQKVEIVSEVGSPSFVVLGNYKGNVNGIQFLFVQKETVKKMAQWMNISKETEDNEKLFQVVQEVVGKMSAAVSESMSAVLESSISYSISGMDLIENSEEDFNMGSFTEDEWFIRATFQLRIGSQENLGLTLCIPVGSAKQIAGEFTEAIDETNKKEEFPSMNQYKATTQPNHPGESPKVQPVQFSNFDESPSHHSEPNNIDLLLDIPLQVTVELGRTKKMVKDILEVSPGSIIELDKLAGEPVDILVNNKLIAVGEVVVIDDNFGVRVTDIISPMDRISKLR